MTQRIALITGGTGGIGTAICKELSRQGCTVIACYFPPEQEEAEAWQQKHREQGHDFAIVPVDVSDYESARTMVESVEQLYGRIDILVNAAGITRDKTLKRMTPDQWKAVINTNLDSAFNITQPVVNGMIERGFGRIINIASVNGQKGQFGQANYSAAKAGLHGFTMAVAQETASRGVTVNTISPGYVETAMTLAMRDDVRDAIISTIPMKRMGSPEEIANAVAFLASDLSRFVTGHTIPADGGTLAAGGWYKRLDGERWTNRPRDP